ALFELLDGATPEAQFVKAIDKLQALAFVLVKKHGELADRHLEFTLRYSEKVVLYFPPLTVQLFGAEIAASPSGRSCHGELPTEHNGQDTTQESGRPAAIQCRQRASYALQRSQDEASAQ